MFPYWKPLERIWCVPMLPKWWISYNFWIWAQSENLLSFTHFFSFGVQIVETKRSYHFINLKILCLILNYVIELKKGFNAIWTQFNIEIHHDYNFVGCIIPPHDYIYICFMAFTFSPNFSKALKAHFLSWNNWCSKVLNNYNLEKNMSKWA
jgi:hypothetical protein